MTTYVVMGSWEFESSFCVGRSRGCEVSITTSEETRTISKRHVGIIPRNETLPSTSPTQSSVRRWIIYDLLTLNGTAVNGVDIPKGGQRELQNGDDVVLASAMRHCVRLLIEFPDRSHSRIIVKAMSRSITPSAEPLNHGMTPRRQVVTNAAIYRRRSTVMTDSSPASTRASPAGTSNNLENMQTPPVRLLSQKRSRCSPKKPVVNENLEKNKQQETPSTQQRKRSRHGTQNVELAVENSDSHSVKFEAALPESDLRTDAEKYRESEKEERERLIVCSVCREYYHGSATLPCSHTFCGYCISKWFRNSLSCPECRDVVKTMPVRNRALDTLVEHLVGQTEAYKSLLRRRERIQRRSVGRLRCEHRRNIEEDASEGAIRGVSRLQLSPNCLIAQNPRSNVFTHWSVEEKLAFSALVDDQFGEARVNTCKKVGLTESAVDRANMTELLVAAQNLLLDYGYHRLIGDECYQRLKLFLYFG